LIVIEELTTVGYRGVWRCLVDEGGGENTNDNLEEEEITKMREWVSVIG
jgi:hypothetical protein